MSEAHGQRSAPATPADASDWPASAHELLVRAVERHGGLSRWGRLSAVELGRFSLGGALPSAKGLGTTFPTPSSVRVEPRAERAVFREYPRAGVDGLYERGDVRLLDRATGATIVASREHEATLTGFRKHRRWTPLDALFFFGRALCDYHSLPFALTEARSVGSRVVRAGSERWTGLEVDLPVERRTHCRRQTFFFDDTGLLRRHDYVSEVVSHLARGCHFWEGWTNVSGIPVALERRVVARLFGRPTPVVVLRARFESAAIELQS